MNCRRHLSPFVALAALLANSLAPAGWAEEAQPTFLKRLRMPHRGDDFSQPRAVVADLHTGEIFICDSFNHRIVIFDDQGRFRYQIPGGNIFRAPVDLAVDPEGRILVVGLLERSSGLARLDFDGRFLGRVVFTKLPPESSPPRIASIAFSPAGDRLFALDDGNHRIWISTPEGEIRGSVDLTVGRTAKEIEQQRYGHLDVYGETVLLPIPSDGLVYTFDLDGRAKKVIGVRGTAYCQTMFPVAAAIDDQGKVLILDQQRAMFMTWESESGRCLAEHYGFGNVPGAFYQPNDLALDALGRIYVTQGFEARVQVYGGRGGSE